MKLLSSNGDEQFLFALDLPLWSITHMNVKKFLKIIFTFQVQNIIVVVVLICRQHRRICRWHIGAILHLTFHHHLLGLRRGRAGEGDKLMREWIGCNLLLWLLFGLLGGVAVEVEGSGEQ